MADETDKRIVETEYVFTIGGVQQGGRGTPGGGGDGKRSRHADDIDDFLDRTDDRRQRETPDSVTDMDWIQRRRGPGLDTRTGRGVHNSGGGAFGRARVIGGAAALGQGAVDAAQTETWLDELKAFKNQAVEELTAKIRQRSVSKLGKIAGVLAIASGIGSAATEGLEETDAAAQARFGRKGTGLERFMGSVANVGEAGAGLIGDFASGIVGLSAIIGVDPSAWQEGIANTVKELFRTDLEIRALVYGAVMTAQAKAEADISQARANAQMRLSRLGLPAWAGGHFRKQIDESIAAHGDQQIAEARKNAQRAEQERLGVADSNSPSNSLAVGVAAGVGTLLGMAPNEGGR